jgi:hypothetical protein
VAALLDQVRQATRALAALTEPASAVGPDLVAAIRKTCEDVELRLSRDDTLIAVASDSPGAKRALLNAVVGARAFDPSARESRSAVVHLRSAAAIDYTARLRDGTVVQFGVRMPDRGESFAKALQRAERERAAAEASEREAQLLVEEAELATTRVPARAASLRRPAGEGAMRRLWLWLLRLWLVLVGRRAAALSVGTRGSPEPPSTLDARRASLEDARARVAQTRSRVDLVRAERAKYDQERAESFVQDLRALTDADGRGADLAELAVVCPTPHLPAGVALVDSPDLSADVDGAVIVGDAPAGADLLARLDDALRPAKPQPVRGIADLAAAIARAQRERMATAAPHAAAVVRRCIARVADAGARAEAASEQRIAALEGQLIPDPAEFRARQMERMGAAIDDGARNVIAISLARWRASIDHTKREWRAGVQGCLDRKAIEALVRTLNQSAPRHVSALVDELGQHAIAELQSVSESLQAWVLEEIHGRYQIARRIEEGDAPAAVIGDALDVDPLGRAPLASTLEKFETRRVGLGLGGVAAGAVLGTLIVPGVGTAIGAFVGVFAGFLKGLDSLKQECVARLDACLDEAEKSVADQVAGRQASFADALRASLDEALDQALARLESSIARLMALERRTIDAERKRRASLAALRASLEEHAARFAALDAAQPEVAL